MTLKQATLQAWRREEDHAFRRESERKEEKGSRPWEVSGREQGGEAIRGPLLTWGDSVRSSEKWEREEEGPQGQGHQVALPWSYRV